MSYLHCPVCSRAFNLAVQPSCPYCPVVATPVDPVDDVVAAAESLARALAHASPAQRAAAAARIKRFTLPAGDAPPAPPAPPPPLRGTAQPRASALRSTGQALTPAPRPAPPKRPPVLATIALAVLDRLAPHAPHRLFRAVHSRVKALAA